MKKVLISYSNHVYKDSQIKLKKSAISPGKVDDSISYTEEWLKTKDFHKKNRYILDQTRGNGYWIWKPYIILETMKNLDDGDIVMYADSGTEIIADLTPLFDLAEKNDRVLFQIADGHQNKTWTKRDCFVLTKCDEKKYWDAVMTTGSYSLWKKTPENIEFLKEYQKFLRDPRIVTDSPNLCGLPNLMEFKDHRHDQSVISLMSIRDGFERFRDPCQYGIKEKDKFDNSPYEQLINHHRKKF